MKVFRNIYIDRCIYLNGKKMIEMCDLMNRFGKKLLGLLII